MSRVVIVGGGIGGLTMALMLHQRGIECTVFEQAPEIKELGVGINTLPHAIRELRDLGLLEDLERVSIRTHELFYLNRQGQEVWRELRGTGAGHDVPQLSISRGALHGVIHRAALARLGDGAIRVDRRLRRFRERDGRVTAEFDSALEADAETVEGDLLIGADGIHSTVRATLFPDEGRPLWNGSILWRGATLWPPFLTGRSMIVAGGLDAKVVVYPIRELAEGNVTNWAIIAKVAPPGTPSPGREDWSRPARLEEMIPHLRGFQIGPVEVEPLIRATAERWEYPMCDRDPLPSWSRGHVTMLGDAAHPMYPVGSNGASQAILDARCLADLLAEEGDPLAALREYEAKRLDATAAVVRSNRTGGPEGVIDAVERLAPDGFDEIESVLSYERRAAIVGGYAKQAGFAVPGNP